MRIFLSASSAQFRVCREAVRSDLAAVGCDVKVQEDFQTGPRSLIERLQEYVAACDRVIALVGDAYGFEASGDAVPVRTPPRSYTQWEYFFALGERLDGSAAGAKDLFVYFASQAFLQSHPVRQSAEEASRQRQFADWIKDSGKHWAAFDSVDQLRAQVLRDGSDQVPATGSDRHQFDALVFASYTSHFARAGDLRIVHAMNDELFEREDLVPAATLEAWWRRNPFTIRIVSNLAGDAIGYWQILPFTADAFQRMAEGRLKEREIGDREILGYRELERGSVYLYVTAVAARRKAPSAPVVLDMIAFVALVHELVGVDGIAALAVSDDPLNLMARFGMTRVDGTDPPVWLLPSRDDVERALTGGRARLHELKGLVPEVPRSEDQSLHELLQRRA